MRVMFELGRKMAAVSVNAHTGAQSYLAGLQHVEHEWHTCRQQLGAVVLRPDGGELCEEGHHHFVPAQLLRSAEGLQPDVEPPGDTWTQQRGTVTPEDLQPGPAQHTIAWSV